MISYSDVPPLKSRRVTATSSRLRGTARSELSITSVTSALEWAGRSAVPANTTSSIWSARSALVNRVPSTHDTASTMFDFPVPLGPTTTETPVPNSRRVRSANDLKPSSLIDLRRKSHPCDSSESEFSGTHREPVLTPLQRREGHHLVLRVRRFFEDFFGQAREKGEYQGTGIFGLPPSDEGGKESRAFVIG